MTTVGSGKYSYELIESWAKLPDGETFGMVSAVATDSKGNVYGFQRKEPPIVIFDPEGNYIGSWGLSAIENPHGIFIEDDIVYITDREDSVCLKYTLDGKPLQILGDRGVHSDTGWKYLVRWCLELQDHLITQQRWFHHHQAIYMYLMDTEMPGSTGSQLMVNSNHHGGSLARVDQTNFTWFTV